MKEAHQPLTDAVFYILLALRRPNHGYGVVQQVEQMTGGRLILGPGTLYGALSQLTERGWIEVYSQQTTSRKKRNMSSLRRGGKPLPKRWSD